MKQDSGIATASLTRFSTARGLRSTLRSSVLRANVEHDGVESFRFHIIGLLGQNLLVYVVKEGQVGLGPVLETDEVVAAFFVASVQTLVVVRTNNGIQ